MNDVKIADLVRAESDHMIRAQIEAFDLVVGRITHLREPMTAENQTVIRVCQDVLYSSTVLDLSAPATSTLPDADGRFVSMLVVNRDHHVLARPSLARTNSPRTPSARGSRTCCSARSSTSPTPTTSLRRMPRRTASRCRAAGPGRSRRRTGTPISSPSMAVYEFLGVEQNDGTTPHAVTVTDVPVDAFWSITVYDEHGYLVANDLGVNSYDIFNAQPNDDGSYTIHFGGCDDGRVNCVPISPGWNFAMRLYRLRAEILDGCWVPPVPGPVA